MRADISVNGVPVAAAEIVMVLGGCDGVRQAVPTSVHIPDTLGLLVLVCAGVRDCRCNGRSVIDVGHGQHVGVRGGCPCIVSASHCDGVRAYVSVDRST